MPRRRASTQPGGAPPYQLLRDAPLSRIRRGDLSAGGILPFKTELCQQYGVSLTTARRALLELAREALVRRLAGVGTLVMEPVRQVRLAFISIDYLGDAWRGISAPIGELIAGIGQLTWCRVASLSMVGVDEHLAERPLNCVIRRRPGRSARDHPPGRARPAADRLRVRQGIPRTHPRPSGRLAAGARGSGDRLRPGPGQARGVVQRGGRPTGRPAPAGPDRGAAWRGRGARRQVVRSGEPGSP